MAGKLAKQRTVLDLGCGLGYGSRYMAEVCDLVLGTDLSPEAVEQANYFQKITNLHFVVSDACALPLLQGQFDLVVSFEVIEHLEAPRRHIAEITRVLAPNGTLLLSTPNKMSMSPYWKNPVWKWHKHEFFEDDLRHLLSDYFDDVQILGEYVRNPKWIARDVRAARLQKIARILPSSVIRAVPMGLIFRVVGFSVPKASLDEVVISADALRLARTFIAVCRRSKRHPKRA
jgi:2-polyprenyl-3-methyl-5-hydroxy-6-metoxy-1,4-benzoquinol methylase